MSGKELYVDPSIAANSGTGTIGDPYGDLEYCIVQETFVTTGGGTRINIKTGTDEILVADLATAMADTSVSPAWAPSQNAQCRIEGYASVAGDLRGTTTLAGISGGGAVGIFNSATLDSIVLQNLHLHNCGAANIIDLDQNVTLDTCELNNTSGGGVIVAGPYMTNCYLHDIGGIGYQSYSAAAVAQYCRFENGTKTFSTALSCAGGGHAHRNIIKVSGASHGLLCGNGNKVTNNSIWSDGGTGDGISWSTAFDLREVLNNVVAGFSGAGGHGITPQNQGATFSTCRLWGGNSVYDCETPFDYGSLYIYVDLEGDETLTSDPFTDASNGDFSPLDTGSVKEGGVPQVIGGGL